MIKLGTIVDSAYRIVGAPREGGMSMIYKAVRLKDRKLLALKILKDEYRRSADALGRLLHEEEIGLMLNHKNIIKIYHHPGEKSFPYQVMEYVEGPTLSEFIEKHRWLTIPSAIRIIIQILDAVDYIHSKGVIHQDLKPENIVLLKNGRIKIIDFGLAYSVNSKNIAWKSLLSVGGTVEYAPPQRINGDISTDTDIFASGVIFYQMLTGQLPYLRNQILNFARQNIRSYPRPPSAYNKNISPKLERIMLKAIALSKEDRFPSAAGFAHNISKVAKKKYKPRKIDWLVVFLMVLFAIIVYILIQIFLILK
ncbi:MAG: serine/threonine protein kinase [Elusimicrobia bacterium]|nr:serine/threonine protein kinase [Elusimicrobiota bacterium]